MLGCNCFKNYFKITAIDISRQQELDSDPKAIQQINFSGNLEQQAKIFFVTEVAKKIILDFSQGNIKVF